MLKPKKLTRKLWGYFALSLLIFSLLMGTVFAFLFVEYNRQSHQEEMRHQAATLAEAYPTFREAGFLAPENLSAAETAPSRHGSRHGMRGSGNASVPGMGQWCRHNYNLQDSGTTGESHRAAFLQEMNHLVQGTIWIVDEKSRTISAYGKESSQAMTGLPRRWRRSCRKCSPVEHLWQIPSPLSLQNPW
ncbi:hypothetical protein [Selenomonas sp. AB3002]|uniref:hypothetical protein n=1 Tax=Selenomonas sp. AB3002 TaxID=1392502 RepID=UPI000495A7C3